MDLLRCCLFTTLALVLLAHTVLSAPMLDEEEMDDDVALSRIVRAALEAASEGDVEEPSVLLKRLRRNSAQWYMGTVTTTPRARQQVQQQMAPPPQTPQPPLWWRSLS